MALSLLARTLIYMVTMRKITIGPVIFQATTLGDDSSRGESTFFQLLEGFKV